MGHRGRLRRPSGTVSEPSVIAMLAQGADNLGSDAAPKKPKGSPREPRDGSNRARRRGNEPETAQDGGCIGLVVAKGGPSFKMTESPKAARGIPTRKTCRRHGGGPSRSRVLWRMSRALITVPLPFSCASVGRRVRWRARPKRIFMYPRRRYTHYAFFSGPADVWYTCLTRGKVRGQVHAVASVDACFTACASAATTKKNALCWFRAQTNLHLIDPHRSGTFLATGFSS